MKIPFWSQVDPDFVPGAGETLENVIKEVLRSDQQILGQKVEAFESQWGGLHNSSYAVGTGNGMDALEIILRCLNLEPGSEVLVPTMTAFASPLAVIRAGAKPIFVDIENSSGLMDIASAEEKLSSRTSALILVHLYGYVKNIDQWKSFANRHGLAFVEDCAQAHMAGPEGQIAGTNGVAGAFSFYPTKNLGAIGDAGAIVTKNEAVAEAARSLRNYGEDGKYNHVHLGMNSRLDEIQAAILLHRLPQLGLWNARRQEIAEFYRQSIRSDLVTTLEAPSESRSHVYHQYVVLVEDRPRFVDFLSKNGVGTSSHYPKPCHLQPAVSGLTAVQPLPHAEEFSQKCVSLPCNPTLDETAMQMVADVVNSYQ